MKPMEIEKQSFAIIEKELTTQIPPQYKPIVKCRNCWVNDYNMRK